MDMCPVSRKSLACPKSNCPFHKQNRFEQEVPLQLFSETIHFPLDVSGEPRLELSFGETPQD